MKSAGCSRSRKSIYFLFFVAAIFLFLTGRNTEAADQAIDKKHKSCSMCHRTDMKAYHEAAASPADLDMSSVCMDCHHYMENHHPVNIVPDGPVNARFPLIDGQIKCLTCHEAHGVNNRAAPNLLRGAPYTDRREICFTCHNMDQYTETNPHVMMETNGNIKEVGGKPVCLICHTKVPDQTNTEEHAVFKADVAFLCWRCHPPMPGIFFKDHFLIKPPTKMVKNIRKFEHENATRIPLLNRDRITCSTCHNPHQAGVIQTTSGNAGAGEPARLRMSKKAICISCHAEY